MAPARREERKIFITRIAVAWEDEAGIRRNETGLLEDSSASGAGIAVSRAIAVGTKVTIRGRYHAMVGIVRYCRRRDLEYIVGLELDNPDVAWLA
jgi:hypothetical protein